MAHSLSYRRILTRLGYYNYQNGLIYRHLNQEGRWENHLEHCRRFILKALEEYKPDKVTVIGSGWLLDLPFAELVERAGRIDMIDIVHPPDVISQVKCFPGVKLIEADATGGLIEEVWLKRGKYKLIQRRNSLSDIIIPEFKPDDDPGMVISLNILTQLESLPITFLKKRSRISDEEVDLFRTRVQKKHVDFLMKHRYVLITDYAELITSRTGDSKTVPTLFTDLPVSAYREEWTWNFDQKGADLYNSVSQFKMVAVTG